MSTSTADSRTAAPAPVSARQYFAALQPDAVYAPLPQSLLPPSASASTASSSSSTSSFSSTPVGPSASPFFTSNVPSFLSELLPTSALSSYPSKLQNKHLQLAAKLPTQKTSKILSSSSSQIDANRKQRRSKRSSYRDKDVMSCKVRKASRLFTIQPDANIQYDMFLPIHELWKQYIQDILGPDITSIQSINPNITMNTAMMMNNIQLQMKLLKCDYHGAIFTILRSNIPAHIGYTGIVIQETQETFILCINKDTHNHHHSNDHHSITKMIMKKNTVFGCELTITSTFSWHVELYGDQLRYRAAERAAKKFKQKPNIQILT